MRGNRGNSRPVARRKYKHRNYSPHGWSSGKPWLLASTAEPTQFEQFIAELGDSPPEMWHQDVRVQRWVREHKNRRYVPEFLLKQLGETVLSDGEVLW